MYYILEKDGKILTLKGKLLITTSYEEAQGLSEGHEIQEISRDDLQSLIPVYDYLVVILELGVRHHHNFAPTYGRIPDVRYD